MFSFDKKNTYILMGIAALVLILTTSLDISKIYAIVGVLVGITFHEFAHAFVAYKLGDDTSKIQGRITLNPLKHVDPLGLITLLILGFGWGKPVQVEPRNFTRKMSVTKAEAIIAAAGPIMNFILAILFSVILCIFMKCNGLILLFQDDTMLIGGSMSNLTFVLFKILNGIIMVNLGLGLFNLIPLPPLDGSKILMNFLPTNVQMWVRENEYMLYIISIILVVLGIAGTLIGFVMNPIYMFLMEKFGMLIGIIG